jgi:transposase
MQRSVVVKYSISFRQQVVADIEAGRFESVNQARIHYGITGNGTIERWLRKYGREKLCAKVVRVEKPDEQNEIRELRKKIKELEQALGQTQAENLLNRSFLKLACKDLGCDVEAFKKKEATTPSTKRAK